VTAAQLAQLIPAVVAVIGSALAGWKALQASRKVDAHTALHDVQAVIHAAETVAPAVTEAESAARRYSDDTSPAKETP
jgi:hypothetical protein